MASIKRFKKGDHVLAPYRSRNGIVYISEWPSIVDSVTIRNQITTYGVRFISYSNREIVELGPIFLSDNVMYVKLLTIFI